MKKMYIVTGADGHLGGTVVRMLEQEDCLVRGLILPGEEGVNRGNVVYYRGDVRRRETLLPLFENTDDMEVTVIHTAGIIDISGKVTPLVYDVNVNGTKTIAGLSLEKQVKRFVYVSSVHAIPENGDYGVMKEVTEFSEKTVTGGYAKTKAEATRAVMALVKLGLDAVVVPPSGILGPVGGPGTHLVQLVNDYIMGRLPACVKGGYDFVDVRDVAKGCLLAASKGRKGECYILSNRHYEIKEVLAMARKVCKCRSVPVLPMWMARAAAPLLAGYAKCRKKRPLYTRYSLYTLKSNDRFSHDKATKELGYSPRDLMQTIKDTVQWLREGKKQICLD